MAFYTYKNAKILIDGTGFFANEAQINVDASLDPAYLANNRHSFNYSASNGVAGNFAFSYYLTGLDPLKAYLNDETQAISGNFGGLYFNSGYLKSYNLSCNPNQSIIANASISFFDGLKGTFTPIYQQAPVAEVLNFSDALLVDPTNGNIGNLSGLIGFDYNFDSDIKPLYYAGETTPNKISFGLKQLSANLLTDNLSGDLPFTGKVAGMRLNLTHPHIAGLTENFTVSGILHQRNISTSVGNLVKSNLSIKQNYIDFPPVVSSITNINATPGGFFLVNGLYLKTTKKILFGQAAANFTILSDTLVSGIVPLDAINGEIIVETYAGATTSGNLTVNYNPILISGLHEPTGQISGNILISGNYFYSITDVIFSTGISGAFNVLSPNIIEATVPEFASWGKIKVSSNVTLQTGLSSQNFVPIPRIDKFTPISGLSGDTITIQGRGFSGVTGVLFNNLPNISPFTTTFSVINYTGITAIVPTGNFKGKIKVLGQSGVLALSSGNFRPIITITGLSPTGAKTGDAIEILGYNFYADLLYRVNSPANTFLTSFGGGDITGLFTRVNNSRLTGFVPYNATSGPVYLYDSDKLQYPSTGNFKLQYYAPTVTSSVPQSGYFSGYAAIAGTNLFNITGVKLVGPTGTINVTPLPSGSLLGNVLYVRYPVATGAYYDVVAQNAVGSATGSGKMYVMNAPILSGLFPSSGGFGEQITISGLNIYPDSKVFFNSTGNPAFIKSGSATTGYNSLQFYVPLSAIGGINQVKLYNNLGWITGQTILINAPTISGHSPTSGTFGDTISISGSNLGVVTNVYLGTGTAVSSFSSVGTTGINFTIPEGSISSNVIVSGYGNSFTYSGFLSLLDPFLTISGFTPISGRWGDTVYITGHRFNTVFSVGFSGSGIELVSYNTGFTTSGITGIAATIPAGTIDNAPIRLTNGRGTVNSSNSLRIIPPTFISDFTSQGAYGDTIQISGTGLGDCTIWFEGNNTGRYVSGLNHVVVNNTGITCLVPREIKAGPLLVSGQGLRLFGTTGNFIPTPLIYSFVPTSIQTGNSLTVSGINAGDILSGFCFITGNGNLQNIVSGDFIKNDTQLTGAGIVNYKTGYGSVTFNVNNDFIGTGAIFFIPNAYSGIISGVNSLLSSNYASQISRAMSGNLTVTQAAPALGGFDPLRGNVNTSVILSGTSLARSTGIYLISGATRSSPGTILITGQNSITFYPPYDFNQRSGQFQLFTEFGNATTSNWFTYITAPFSSGMYPTQGITGSLVSFSGSGIADLTGVSFSPYPGINYQASFVTGLIGTVYVVSGTVPLIKEGFARTATVTLSSEGGSHVLSNQFIIRHEGTEIHGHLSGKALIFSSGFVTQNSGLITGNLTSSMEVTGNHIVFNFFTADGVKYRGLSYKYQ